MVAGQALTAARAAATRHTLPPHRPPRPAAPRARRSPRHTRASAAHRRHMPPGSAAAPRRPARALSVCRSRDRRTVVGLLVKLSTLSRGESVSTYRFVV
eukprot:scaffold46150_cov63-Phaeocystis_antarctica.AAC.1